MQVAAVREGMSTIVPVPLLSLCTARMLETSVCGQEEVDLWMLKKVVRYSAREQVMCIVNGQLLVCTLLSLVRGVSSLITQKVFECTQGRT